MPNAKEVLDVTRAVYLNDAAGVTYTDTLLLPHLRSAYDFLITGLQENDIPTCNGEEVKTIAANQDEYYPLPPDFFLPVKLEERKPSSTDEYGPMYLYRELPVVTKSTTLMYWAWIGDRIKFVGATTSREVKLSYQKVYPGLYAPDAAIFGKAEQYLSAKTAALVHMFITQIPTLAEAANGVAEGEFNQIINMQVKKLQAIKSRPLPYLPFRRR